MQNAAKPQKGLGQHWRDAGGALLLYLNRITLTGPLALPLSRAGGWVLSALLLALVWIGVYPQPFVRLVLSLPLR